MKKAISATNLLIVFIVILHKRNLISGTMFYGGVGQMLS